MEHKGPEGAFCLGGLVELASWALKVGQCGWNAVMSKGMRGPDAARQVTHDHARLCALC